MGSSINENECWSWFCDEIEIGSCNGNFDLRLVPYSGAGASYDSLARLPARNSHGFEGRPPLAKQLFNPGFGPYIGQFPQAHGLITDLEKEDSDVEALLEKFQRDAETDYPRGRVQITAIRYYLQTMLLGCLANWETVTFGVTNYNPLLYQIDHRVQGDKILVSFNYDTLLEEALLATVGVKIEKPSDYLGSEYKVIKLHGSINWAHKVMLPTIDLNRGQSQVASELIERTSELMVNDSFEVIPKHVIATYRGQPIAMLGDKPAIPALSIPVANKSVYECPLDHRQAMLDCLPEVNKILVVGWRGTENRFLDDLTHYVNPKVKIMVVSSSERSAGDVINRIQGRMRVAGRQADYIAAKGDFSNAIQNHEIEGFLRQ